MTPSAPTCSTSSAHSNLFRERAAATAHRKRSGQVCSGCSTGSTRQPMCATAAWDILAMNKLGEALYSEILANPRRPANSARFCFLDPRATTFFIDWDKTADASVAVLRAEAGRNPHDQDLTNLIGELSTQSEDFRVRWARHDVGTHDAGVKQLHRPLVGHVELTYEGMTLAADPDLVLFAFTAEIGSRSEEALNLLASWSATPDQRVAGELGERT
jgi:MmyB-like transcription regulator ligand binding domain